MFCGCQGYILQQPNTMMRNLFSQNLNVNQQLTSLQNENRRLSAIEWQLNNEKKKTIMLENQIKELTRTKMIQENDFKVKEQRFINYENQWKKMENTLKSANSTKSDRITRLLMEMEKLSKQNKEILQKKGIDLDNLRKDSEVKMKTMITKKNIELEKMRLECINKTKNLKESNEKVLKEKNEEISKAKEEFEEMLNKKNEEIGDLSKNLTETKEESKILEEKEKNEEISKTKEEFEEILNKKNKEIGDLSKNLKETKEESKILEEKVINMVKEFGIILEEMGKDSQLLKIKYGKLLVLNEKLRKTKQKDGSTNGFDDQKHGERIGKRKDFSANDVGTKKRRAEQNSHSLVDEKRTIQENVSRYDYTGAFQPSTPMFASQSFGRNNIQGLREEANLCESVGQGYYMFCSTPVPVFSSWGSGQPVFYQQRNGENGLPLPNPLQPQYFYQSNVQTNASEVNCQQKAPTTEDWNNLYGDQAEETSNAEGKAGQGGVIDLIVLDESDDEKEEIKKERDHDVTL
uniref:Uncharacterized protein n=1 Tax=Panagrolaimus sp. JU765 TaxID=591449 RepID=A0AC34RCH4_9BILA